MKFKAVLGCAAVLIFFNTGFAWAEKIAVVLSRSLAPYQAALQGFSENAPGEIENFNMQGDEVQGAQIMDKIAAGGFNTVVVIGSEAAKAAKNITNLPVIYTMVLEKPVFKTSQSTGIILDAKIEDKVRYLKQLFPQIKKVGVIYNPEKTGKIVNQARQAMSNVGLILIPLAINAPEEFKGALDKLTKDQVDLIWSVPDPLTLKPEAVNSTIEHAVAQKLPFVAMTEAHVAAGALAAFSVDFGELGAQTAEVVKGVLEGKHPLAAYYPKRVILYVNADVQNKLGLKDFQESSEIKIIKK